MDVLEAVASRYSCRAFLPTLVPEKTVREIVERAARAPSAGNMQPWRIYAIAGGRINELKALMGPRMATELPFRRAGCLIFCPRKSSRTGAMGRHRRLSSNCCLARTRVRFAYLPATGVGFIPPHRACFSGTPGQFDGLFGFSPRLRRCGCPDQYLAFSTRAGGPLCVVRGLR